MSRSSGLDLSRYLLDLDDHELGGLERRESDDDVHDAAIDVALRRRFLVAFDEVRVPWRAALERALAEQVLHERAEIQAQLRPERLVVRLEDGPLAAAVEAFLDEQREPPHGHVLPLRGEPVGPA